MMPKLIHGWNRDAHDSRDWLYSEVRHRPFVFPARANCEKYEPPVWDQTTIGSCVGHGSLSVLAATLSKNGIVTPPLSRLMPYYEARQIEGTIDQDSGAQVRDGMKGLATNGSCPESMWPYDVSKFAVAPPGDAWTAALAHCLKDYARLQNATLDQLKACIVAGDPFTFGFDVPASFEEDEIAKSGTLQVPTARWTPVGGHCVSSFRYDDAFHPPQWRDPGGFYIRNSWGPDWGTRGHFWMPYEFITSRACSDFWTGTRAGYGSSPSIH